MAFRIPLYVQPGGTTPIIREYTSSDTWNKPSGLKYVWVVAVGAGGGGGSGRKDGNTVSRQGGGGGGGGALVARMIDQSEITGSSVSIVIGSGGIGGAPQTVNTTSGLPGSVGGNTLFGSFVTAAGGGGGGGGIRTNTVSNAGVGGDVTNCVPGYSPHNGTGASGGMGRAAQVGDTGESAVQINVRGGAGGGGGGGLATTSTNAFAGGDGGGVLVQGVLTAGPTGSAPNVNGINGTDDIGVYLSFIVSVSSSFGIGTGGSGGGGGVGGNAAAGGNGGRCSGGGGGGGATNNIGNSGEGGSGGNGYLYLLEFY
jgi:hypothetical protein